MQLQWSKEALRDLDQFGTNTPHTRTVIEKQIQSGVLKFGFVQGCLKGGKKDGARFSAYFEFLSRKNLVISSVNFEDCVIPGSKK